MQRYCFNLELKPGMEEEYERRHDELWPELSDAIRGAGISNFTLFRRDLQVIGYCECEPDAPTALGRIEGTEIDRRWTESMSDLMEPEAGEPFAYDEVWHQD